MPAANFITCILQCTHCVAGRNTIIAHIMRERIRCGLQNSQGDFTQMVHSLSKHPGLQAVFKQQITDGLTVWHDSLTKLFTTFPFLTRLDLSKCAAIVSDEDYTQLALLPYNSTFDYWLSGEAGSVKSAADAGKVVHPCASAVTKQQPLPISIKRLLPMLERLSCLQMLHLCLTKVTLPLPRLALMFPVWHYYHRHRKSHVCIAKCCRTLHSVTYPLHSTKLH